MNIGMSRRSALLGGLALPASLSFPNWSVAAEVRAGTRRVTTLSDGHLVLPLNFILGGDPTERDASILERHGIEGNTIEPPCYVTLLRDDEDGTVALFDTGAGSQFASSAGLLPDALASIGIAPEDVTHVLFTHAHPDHLGGVLDEFDDPLFPNAKMGIGAVEWDFWINAAAASESGHARAGFAEAAARRLRAIEASVERFRDGDEPLPGVAAFDTFGHTPGHMSFDVQLGSEILTVVGDAIGNAHLAFETPERPLGMDQDSERAAATRLALLDRLATDGSLFVGYHLPEGGLGRCARRGDSFEFLPESV